MILVTGGCGFIASNFVNFLLEQYPHEKILNIDKMDRVSNENYICSKYRENRARYQLVKLDLLNLEGLQKVLTQHLADIDTVFHFAAQSHVDISFEDPVGCVYNNVMGSLNLLLALQPAVERGLIKRIVHISTDEVYGDVLSDVGAKETDVLEPTNPYSASKACVDQLMRAWTQGYKFPIIIVRPNNVYGPHQFPEKVIPKFIQQCLRGQSLTLHGDGHQTRFFVYVKDICEAIRVVWQKGKIGEIYNLGGTQECSIQNLAHMIGDMVKSEKGEEPEVKTVKVQDRIYNDRRYWVCSDKIRDLGWTETYTLQKGLAEMIPWYKNLEALQAQDTFLPALVPKP